MFTPVGECYQPIRSAPSLRPQESKPNPGAENIDRTLNAAIHRRNGETFLEYLPRRRQWVVRSAATGGGYSATAASIRLRGSVLTRRKWLRFSPPLTLLDKMTNSIQR